jgi:hypothetical protein
MKGYWIKILLLTFLFAGTISCNKFDKCEGVICFTPPQSFFLEIVDKTIEENLYTSNELLADNIALKNESDEIVDVEFIKEDGVNLINISAIGWEIGVHTYYLTLSEDLEIKIEIEMQEKHEDCCTYFNVAHFDIPGYEFERSQYSEIIKIKI